ncbi:MAG: hydroxymethylbilane synthase [Oscillospiraceae bacterium]
MKIIRVGSRESQLAVVQSQLVIAAIHKTDPALSVELVTMKTTGDKILDRTLDEVGGKGLFVKELDAALLAGTVDVTVHSCKDLPMETDPRLPLVGFSKREDPRDVLVLPEGVTELDTTKPVGCSSQRRTLQLHKLLPDCAITSVRGNVQTRLRKLDSGEYSALVLAAAGLKRLGLEGRISRYFSADEMLPAAGQGVLAAQTRAGEDCDYLRGFLDEEATLCVTAERAFVKEMDGGCSSPIGAYGVLQGDTLTLEGMDASGNRETISGDKAQAEKLGVTLALRMKKQVAAV